MSKDKKCRVFPNKRADMSARKMLFYVIVGFFLVIGFLLLVSVVISDKSEVGEMPEGLEDYLLVQRFLNSPSCFAFQDAISERVYLWVIDPIKFTEANLHRCYNARDTKVKAYRLTLSYEGRKITISTKNWEGFLKKAETISLLVHDNGKLIQGRLFIEVQDAK